MSLIFEERLSASPYIELVTQGYTTHADSVIRPSESHWHMVFVQVNGITYPIIAGALPTSGIATWGEGAEILWIKFKIGTYMPHLPPKMTFNKETRLPNATGQNFWLNSDEWQIPSYENVETFVDWMVQDELLIYDPVVQAALDDNLPPMSPRTVRHRFLQTTGLTRSHIRQAQRAQQAARLLECGTPILDVVFELGYTDQPHLTKSLKRFIGKTPGQQFVRACQPG